MKRVLLDGGVPRELMHHFPAGFQVTRAQTLGWHDKSNGALLSLVGQASFDAFVTMDAGMGTETDGIAPCPVFVLRAPAQNDLKYLITLIETDVVNALQQGAENRYYFLGAARRRKRGAPSLAGRTQGR